MAVFVCVCMYASGVGERRSVVVVGRAHSDKPAWVRVHPRRTPSLSSPHTLRRTRIPHRLRHRPQRQRPSTRLPLTPTHDNHNSLSIDYRSVLKCAADAHNHRVYRLSISVDSDWNAVEVHSDHNDNALLSHSNS